MDIRQSDKYGSYMEAIGWKTIKTQGVQIFIRELGLLGGIAKIQRSIFPLPWEETDYVLRKHHVWMCKYEPDVKMTNDKGGDLNIQEIASGLRDRGFKQDKWPLVVSKTTTINLTLSLKRIMEGFKKDARYALRKHSESDFKFSLNLFDQFYDIWRRAAKLKRLWIPSLVGYRALIESFESDCFCITATSIKGDSLGGVFVLIADKVAYYYYSATLPAGKLVDSPYFLVWETIKEAKRRGCKSWDFEGVYDSRWPNKDWKGFSHFKKSFGGKEISYIGSFTRYLWPF